MNYTRNAEMVLEETIDSLRNKPVKSTMLERLYITEQADHVVKGLKQPLQLGKGLYYILDNVSVPVKKYDLLAGRVIEKLPTEEEETYLQKFLAKYGWRPSWFSDDGHITLFWEHLLGKGIKGLEEEAFKDGDEGKYWIYKAFRRYVERYAEEAKRCGNESIRKICQTISIRPAQTFNEALQIILLIGHAYSVYACINSTLSYGRLDVLLRRYYENDLMSGTLSEMEARALILDFYCKNSLILGRGEHQIGQDAETETGWFRNPVYDTPQYVILGGYTDEKGYDDNPLTKLFLESIIPRFENPVFVFRRTKATNDLIWRCVCEKLRDNASMIVYNDETMLPAFLQAGIRMEDAFSYSIHGCNWPDIPGVYKLVAHHTIELPRLVMDSLRQENCIASQGIEEIYKAIGIRFKKSMQNSIQQVLALKKETTAEILKCEDCFYDEIRYSVIYNQIKSIATAADILSAVHRLVIMDRQISLTELLEAIDHNFNGCEEIRKLCLSVDKFGNDNDFADEHATHLMSSIVSIAREVSNGTGITVFTITTTDMDHILDGQKMKATPDGRLSGTPLSENLSPSVGCGGDITALLNSVSKLPFSDIHAGAFNLKIRKDWLKGSKGLFILQNVIKTFFEMGGMQVQVSVTDENELREAQKYPEKYKDLIVRITGYSAVFVDMCEKAQEEFISRESL